MKSKPKKLFGGGYRRPIAEDGLKWCNCFVPNLISPIGRGQAYCLRCKTPYYH